MNHALDFSNAVWRKSTRSGASGCVEVATIDRVVGVRDSKDREGPVLVFTDEEWNAFLAGVQDGEFELGSSPALSSNYAEADLSSLISTDS